MVCTMASVDTRMYKAWMMVVVDCYEQPLVDAVYFHLEVCKVHDSVA